VGKTPTGVGMSDVVTTSPDSMAIFVIGKDVYLIRDISRVDAAPQNIRLVTSSRSFDER
jgi:hypothetical protein